MKARWRGDGQDAAYIMAAQEKRERKAQKRLRDARRREAGR